ncbi:small hydrophobic protein [avian metapneumovirus]|uniref:Small hydrophobic protein n=1 Tax=avian metapneumovirus TaxID=38525 RepID=Q80G94_9MONO|nr:small hydrophobic protein [Avian metapneumovirus]AAT86115.1 small hydrophobic protein [Avian metapneumovirus]AAT86118.1 small hydrophobic protein [Avian metapneumovirus]CAD30203.1 small hydrophobic protein [Avian metapneumovirus]
MEPLKVSGSGGIPMKTRLNIILEKSINKILIILGLLLTASTVITITLTVEYIRVENELQLCKMEAEVAKTTPEPPTQPTKTTPTLTRTRSTTASLKTRPVSRTTHPTNPSCWREEEKCQNITAKWSNCFGTSLPVRVNCTVLRELCDEQPGNHTTVQVSRRCTCIYALNWDCSYA